MEIVFPGSKLGTIAKPIPEINSVKFYKIVNGEQIEVGGGESSIAVHALSNAGAEVENSPIASINTLTLKAGTNITLSMDMTGVVTITSTNTAPTSLDASIITSGILDIARIPQAAIERLVTVADQTARFALTTATVQAGDTVKELDTGYLFAVVDEANLGNANGYAQYTAGGVSSVAWAAVTEKPTTLLGYGITDAATATHNHNSSYEPKNTNIQTHIASTSNPHSVTAAQAGAMATSHAANSITGLGASGTATTVARSDHKHTDCRTISLQDGTPPAKWYSEEQKTLTKAVVDFTSAPTSAVTITMYNQVGTNTATTLATLSGLIAAYTVVDVTDVTVPAQSRTWGECSAFNGAGTVSVGLVMQ